MTLDSGLRRHDVQGILLCPDILEHRLSEGVRGFKNEAVALRQAQGGRVWIDSW